MKTLNAKLLRQISLPIFLLIMASIGSVVYGQDPVPLEWHTFYGGHPTELNRTDEGKSIFECDGFLYVAGFASGPGNFDGATIKRQWLGGRDGVVMRTNLGMP